MVLGKFPAVALRVAATLVVAGQPESNRSHDYHHSAALCQIFDSIFLDVPMARVKFNVNTEYAYLQNFKILQSATPVPLHPYISTLRLTLRAYRLLY